MSLPFGPLKYRRIKQIPCLQLDSSKVLTIFWDCNIKLRNMIGDCSTASALSSLQTLTNSSFYSFNSWSLSLNLKWEDSYFLFCFVLFLRPGSTGLLFSACQLLEVAMKPSVARSVIFYPWFHKGHLPIALHFERIYHLPMAVNFELNADTKRHFSSYIFAD